jgi:hypothetical protein
MAVTYNSVVQKLNAFSLANAANHNAAVAQLEEFTNEIEPEIDQIYPNLSLQQKEAIRQKKAAIHQQMMNQFPRPAANVVAPNGGGKRRKTRAAKLRRRKQKKTRNNKKGTRRH